MRNKQGLRRPLLHLASFEESVGPSRRSAEDSLRVVGLLSWLAVVEVAAEVAVVAWATHSWD